MSAERRVFGVPAPVVTLVVLSALLGGASARDVRLPADETSLFSGSGNCGFCHTATENVLRDSAGNDLSIDHDWRSTMMANAAKDPYWQAKVESEVARHPELRSVIETTCTRCHTPMGNVQALFEGATEYFLETARESPLAMDGVSCTVCHQIQDVNLGTDDSFSGGFTIDDARIIFGPYEDPYEFSMESINNYTPALGTHVNRSELCATCHTLFTPFLDNDGQIAGMFPEQVPFLEWSNSIHSAAGRECQSCHMPVVDEPVRIARGPHFLPSRSPVFRHFFVGGNAFMVDLMRDNGDELGVTAEDHHLSTTAERARAQLREHTARLSVEAFAERSELLLEAEVENLAGHKFPTGFPSRRAWLHVRVENDVGETVFESGALASDGEIEGLSTGHQPHWDVIDREDQVQVYEAVTGDVDGHVTFTLLRASGYLKDNRLPPQGFVSTAPRYADMAIQGEAVEDDDFNRGPDGEGTGRDQVSYRLDLSGEGGRLDVLVELLYQSVPPRFVGEGLASGGEAVGRFRRYYASAPKTAEIVQSVSLQVDLPGGSGRRFIRSDTNQDGAIDLTDAVTTFIWLFEEYELGCVASADTDDSGVIDVTDGIRTLNWLFLGGPEPAPPLWSCGFDPTEDELGCVEYRCP